MPHPNWMSWEAGVDVVARTQPGLAEPNLILHTARIVHTPVGSAPAGLLLWQPDPAAAPALFGFVCADARLGAWFGPHIFAGTPFERAPVLAARIEVRAEEGIARSHIEVGGHTFEVALSGLAAPVLVHRPAGAPMPFAQQGLEAKAARVSIALDGKALPVEVPALAMGGGPGACFAAAGLYARV